MFVIAQPYARFRATLGEDTLSRAAVDIETFTESALRERFGEQYDLLRMIVVVRIETGSTKLWVKIAVPVSTAATALALYGNLRQSLDYLVHDARAISSLVLTHAPESLGVHEAPEYQRRSLGSVGELRALFDRVERGEMSAEEATNRAIAVVGQDAEPDESAQVAQLVRKLNRKLSEVKPVPSHDSRDPVAVTHQQQLPGIREDSGAPPRRRPSRKAPDVPVAVMPTRPPVRRRGVEVTRDRRTGRLVMRKY